MVAEADFVNMSFTGALECERSFLGPFYQCLVLHPRGSTRRVPSRVRFMLRLFSQRVQESRHYSCAMSSYSSATAARVDAQPSEGRTGIGGWFPILDLHGFLNVGRSLWFSVEISVISWDWVFEKSGKPAVLVVALKASV